MILVAGVCLLFASISHGYDFSSEKENVRMFGTKLRSIKHALEDVIKRQAEVKEAHLSIADINQFFTRMLEETKQQAEFSEYMDRRSLRFMWKQIQYELNTLQNKIEVPRKNSTTPISLPLDDTINLLVRIRSVVGNILPEDFTYWPKHTKNAILGFVRAYRLLQASRKLDDRPLHKYEKDLFKSINNILEEGEDRLKEDPEAKAALLPSEEPTDEELDSAFELEHGSLYHEFESSLQDVEKDVFKLIGGVDVVVQGTTCMLFSTIGKWYLANYPCHLW